VKEAEETSAAANHRWRLTCQRRERPQICFATSFRCARAFARENAKECLESQRPRGASTKIWGEDEVRGGGVFCHLPVRISRPRLEEGRPGRRRCRLRIWHSISICAGIAIPYMCASIERCCAAALMGPCKRGCLLYI
jgi:hypothetical protein